MPDRRGAGVASVITDSPLFLAALSSGDRATVFGPALRAIRVADLKPTDAPAPAGPCRVGLTPVLNGSSPYPVNFVWIEGTLLLGYDPEQISRDLAAYIAGLVVGGPFTDIDAPETADSE